MSQTEVVNDVGKCVRSAADGDVAAIAELHATSIHEGFLVQLGRPFLERLYRRAVRSRHAFVLVAGDPGDVRGFIAASVDTNAFYREFLGRDALVAGIVALPRIARAVRPVLETLRYGVRDHEELPKAEILAVAVDSDRRAKGTGTALIVSAVEELARRGVASARVVTAVDNASAIRAYGHGGFRRHGTTRVHRGVDQALLVWP
jgi:ribosomal protein S18 acetylase RimI-like enzyme